MYNKTHTWHLCVTKVVLFYAANLTLKNSRAKKTNPFLIYEQNLKSYAENITHVKSKPSKFNSNCGQLNHLFM